MARKPAAKSAKPSTKAAKRRDALVTLARTLGGAKATKIANEVALAIDDTARFLAATKHELFEDWDDDASDVPWLALIEALNAAGRLAEVDWKEAASEVLAWLEKIGGAPAKRALVAAHEPALDERYTDEALALFGKMLSAGQLALVQLDKDSDSYALIIVAVGEVASLAKLARTAGGAIVHWTGKDLAKLEAERIRKLARAKTANPWRQLVAARGGTEDVLVRLRHDHDGSHRAAIRAALPFVPERDRALVELSLALNEQPASAIAKTTRDPALCLRALGSVRDYEDPKERLWAASVLAGRLKIKPDHGKIHRQLGVALNLWADDDAVDAAFAKLPAAERERLARLADALLPRNSTGSYELAAQAMGHVGDATSLELLLAIDAKERAAAEARAKRHPTSWSRDPWTSLSNVPKAIERLRKRVSAGAPRAPRTDGSRRAR